MSSVFHFLWAVLPCACSYSQAHSWNKVQNFAELVKFSAKGLTIRAGTVIMFMKSENDTGFGKEEQEMRYAINSDMIMMYMGMRRMCMRTLCNALNSEPFSTQK